MRPAFETLDFTGHRLTKGGWPFLFAERIKNASHPTVFGYGHGDVIRGLDDSY
jgi:hypothetical protein